MPLKAILGRRLEAQNFTASWGINICSEEWLVEMDSPLEDQTDVVSHLPAYGQTEPTFTIGHSPHPTRTDLILKSCDGVREAPDGRPYWIVSVTYESPQFVNELLPREDQGRGNVGRKKKINEITGDSIILPWDEPPTWSSSIRTVRTTKFKDANDKPLVHANGLPVTEGIDCELYLEVHQFTWNKQYTGFNYTTQVRPYIDKVNNAICFGMPLFTVYCESITCTENYRSVNVPTPDGQSQTQYTFHFVTLNATFVFDPRPDTVLGHFKEANRRVSMHTMERLILANPVTGIAEAVYLPINVNSRGDVAEAPWPLLSKTKAAVLGKQFGQAVPYDIMNTVDPEADFHYVNLLLPKLENLEAFRLANNLKIPGIP